MSTWTGTSRITHNTEADWDDEDNWPPSSQRYYSETPKKREVASTLEVIRDMEEEEEEEEERDEETESAVRESSPSGEATIGNKRARKIPDSDAETDDGKSEDELFEPPPKRRQIDPSSGLSKPKTPYEEHIAFLAEPRVRNGTVLNPNFLQSFYSNSRLHHLSTWRAELKSQFQALTASLPPRPPIPKSVKRRYILHVDFDSFFCSVSLLSHPELKDKPVVVCHGSSTGSSNEIASCNYIARGFGVKNGMWMARAKELCPEVQVVGYEFDKYEEASREFYRVLVGVGADCLQSVSIDEALLDVTSLCISTNSEPPSTAEQVEQEYAKVEQLSRQIRDRIRERAHCEVSVGCGGNILLAKLALRKAKPGGQYHLKPEEVIEFMSPLSPEALPGIGHSIAKRLQELNLLTVADICAVNKDFLRKHCGEKTGDKLYDYARGIDTTVIGDQVSRKSVTADINWGVRFENYVQVYEFLSRLSAELSKRLENIDLVGRHITLKLMIRSKGAPIITPKFLGCGKCDTFNRSTEISVSTSDKVKIEKEVVALMKGFEKFPVEDIRGIGLQMTKLESKLAAAKQQVLGFEKKEKPQSSRAETKLSEEAPVSTESAMEGPTPKDDIPPDANIDMEVLYALPEDIRREVLESLRQERQRENRPPSPPRSILPPRKPKMRQIRLPVLKSSTNREGREDSPNPADQWGKLLGGRKKEDISKFMEATPPVQENYGRTGKSTESSLPPQAPDYTSSRGTSALHPTYTLPPFQSLTKPFQILNLVTKWHESTLETGPDPEDVNIWGQYLRSLVESDDRVIRKIARGMVRWFAEKVEISDSQSLSS